MSDIHPAAIIEEGAEIGEDVKIEPYAVIKKNVKIGRGCVIKAHAYIDGNTKIGSGTTVWPGACIGLQTQDLKFHGEETFVEIGDNCQIREYVTINASCGEGSYVRVGNNCHIMAYCHVAHNCEIGNNVIMANGAMLAGHITVEDNVNIGGMTPVHQNVRIGCHAMVGGFSRVTRDIPPYSIGAGSPYKLGGLNLVGLKRKNFSLETRKALNQAFKRTFRSGLSLKDALSLIEKEVDMTEEVKHWVEFCRNTKRGVTGAVELEETGSREANCEKLGKLSEKTLSPSS